MLSRTEKTEGCANKTSLEFSEDRAGSNIGVFSAHKVRHKDLTMTIFTVVCCTMEIVLV